MATTGTRGRPESLSSASTPAPRLKIARRLVNGAKALGGGSQAAA